MNERELRRLIGDVKKGRLSRRGFVQRMMAVGLAAPMATQLLAYSGVAMAQSQPAYKPTKRGGGGLLKVLWWQGPTLLNPHFAVGTKDQDGSRVFYEPLAGWDPAGNLKPVLAASDPRPRGRHPGGRRQVGDLEAEAGRHLARRQAVHCRRRRLQLGIRQGSGDRRHDHRHLQGRHGREDRRSYREGEVPEADAVLGRRLRRHARHDHPQASVRRLYRRQVARRADQPQAGRHRSLQVQGVQAGRHGRRRDQHRTTTWRTGPTSTASR